MSLLSTELLQALTKTCSPESNNILIQGTVFGHLPSGKNNYVMRNGHMYRTQEVMDYEISATPQLNVIRRIYKIKPSIDLPCLLLVAKVFFRSFRRDVDTILFCDLLQKTGIIKNDRALRIKLISGVDKDSKNPRVEFALYKIEERPT